MALFSYLNTRKAPRPRNASGLTYILILPMPSSAVSWRAFSRKLTEEDAAYLDASRLDGIKKSAIGVTQQLLDHIEFFRGSLGFLLYHLGLGIWPRWYKDYGYICLGAWPSSCNLHTRQ